MDNLWKIWKLQPWHRTNAPRIYWSANWHQKVACPRPESAAESSDGDRMYPRSTGRETRLDTILESWTHKLRASGVRPMWRCKKYVTMAICLLYSYVKVIFNWSTPSCECGYWYWYWVTGRYNQNGLLMRYHGHIIGFPNQHLLFDESIGVRSTGSCQDSAPLAIFNRHVWEN